MWGLGNDVVVGSKAISPYSFKSLNINKSKFDRELEWKTMQIIDEYELIIKAYCANRESFITKFSRETNSDILKSLILSLKLDFLSYKNLVGTIDIEQIDKNSMDYFIYLEGKIRYIACTESMEIYRKKNSPLVKEFLDKCGQALAIYPYAFIASTELSLRLEIQRQYKKALPLLQNIYDYGFKSKITLYSIILLSTAAHDWKVARLYDKFVQPKINHYLTSIFIVFEKYSLIRITFGLICIYLFLLSIWFYFFGLLMIMNIVIFVCSYYYKNRTLLKLFFEVLLILMVVISTRLLLLVK
jgi:hypothetical protein